jgi:rRNA-processing protein FCF1
LVEVICDTSFLIHLATKQTRNIDSINIEIGQIEFVVPLVVLSELKELTKRSTKYRSDNAKFQSKNAVKTLEFARNLKTISISGTYADKEIIKHVKKHGGIIGCMDKELKSRIKHLGGSIMSFSNNRIVLES